MGVDLQEVFLDEFTFLGIIGAKGDVFPVFSYLARTKWLYGAPSSRSFDPSVGAFLNYSARDGYVEAGREYILGCNINRIIATWVCIG